LVRGAVRRCPRGLLLYLLSRWCKVRRVVRGDVLLGRRGVVARRDLLLVPLLRHHALGTVLIRRVGRHGVSWGASVRRQMSWGDTMR